MPHVTIIAPAGPLVYLGAIRQHPRTELALVFDFPPDQKLIGVAPRGDMPSFGEFLYMVERLRGLKGCMARLTNMDVGIALHLEGAADPQDLDLAIDAFGDFVGRSDWRGKPSRSRERRH